MVSALTRVFGPTNLDLAEDVVQETLLLAVQRWPFDGVPNNPAGWLYQVAKNKAIDAPSARSPTPKRSKVTTCCRRRSARCTSISDSSRRPSDTSNELAR